MSTEIKNTLFRFVTMRAPELIETEKVEKNFVIHPNIGLCFFKQYLESEYVVGLTKKQALKNGADYIGTQTDTFKSREDVKAYVNEASADLYEFAIWLTKNRNQLTLDELTEKINFINGQPRTQPLAPIADIMKRVHIWNQIMYQVISFKSGYVRDAILSVLVADFFLSNYDAATFDLTAARKLAKARVIMPFEIFGAENSLTSETARMSPSENKAIISRDTVKSAEIISLEDQIQSVKNLLGEVGKAEKKYTREDKKLLKEYNRKFDDLVKMAYDKAEKIEIRIIDPITHAERIEYEYKNLELPTYEFTSQNDLEFLLSFLSPKNEHYESIKSLYENEGLETFEDLRETIKTKLSSLTEKLFEKTSFSKQMVAMGGVVLPQENLSVNRTQNNYEVSTVGGVVGKKLLITFPGMEAGARVVSGNFTINFTEEGSEPYVGSFGATLNSNQWSTGQFCLRFPFVATNPIAALYDGSFSIDGHFLTEDGRDLFLDPGYGTITTTSTGNGPSGHTLDPNFDLNENTIGSGENFIATASGIYRHEDLSVVNPDDGNSNPDSGSNNNGSNNSSNNGSNNTGNNSQTTLDYIPSGFGIKRLGIADYRKVEQEVCCYVPGEVSHIENVMAREFKSRTTKSTIRMEETTTDTSERESEKLTDTTTVDRFEMNQEVNSVIAEDTQIGAHANLNAQWGNSETAKYTLNAGGDFANNTSSEESNHQAVTHAKEVTERALERVVTKVKQERVKKITNEFIDENSHGFDNRQGSSHISGVYRWIDKIYRNKVINYGKRLMYEFLIPEPATFHTMLIEGKNEATNGEILIKPIDPRTVEGTLALTDYTKITEATYSHWAGVYNADVKACPSEFIYIGKEFNFDSKLKGGDSWSDKANLNIPEGYKTKESIVTVTSAGMLSSWGKSISVSVGNLDYHTTNSNFNMRLNPTTDTALKEFEGSIPISMFFITHHGGNANVSIKCQLSDTARNQWKIETFNEIISAYENKLAEYNAKVAGVKAKGTNPLFNRQIINDVLRKNCIEYLISQDSLGKESMLVGDSITTTRARYDEAALETYTAKVKFFEQAFEWDLMSYYFYPFYWAYKNTWKAKHNVDEMNDPAFRAFLQSGMARIILTIRPGFEEAVNWYMSTGQVWNGGQVPAFDDPLYVSIVEELNVTEGEVEETWESRVPTALTILQAESIGLNVVSALPCDADCGDNLLFDSDGQPLLDAEGRQMKSFVKTGALIGLAPPSEESQTSGTLIPNGQLEPLEP
jgi:hypothetical protein